jgi:hypothetical protein
MFGLPLHQREQVAADGTRVDRTASEGSAAISSADASPPSQSVKAGTSARLRRTPDLPDQALGQVHYQRPLPPGHPYSTANPPNASSKARLATIDERHTRSSKVRSHA